MGAGRVNVLAVSITEAGRALATRLPYERAHGAMAPTVRERWHDIEGLVLFVATGVAVRIVAPLLADKQHDPGVVCVDETGRYAISLCGGHGGRANDLAREVAALLGAEPIITTASDAAGTVALDTLPGFDAVGDLAGVSRAMLDGRLPTIESDLPAWPLPPSLFAGEGPERVVVTDQRSACPEPGTVLLHPPSLVAGIGTSTGAAPEEVAGLLVDVLERHALALESIGLIATVDRRRAEPAILALGRPVRSFPADELATVAVPTPSPVVDATIGTPSVAEAAALLAAGPQAELVVAKAKNKVATVAIARRARPQGRITVVGLGPGGPWHRTPAAAASVRAAEVVIGYDRYIDQAGDLLGAGQRVVRSPIGDEVERARMAIAEAGAGRFVAIVCSGDPGIYGMASVVIEEIGRVGEAVEVVVVPGVTASLAASAVLGAPIGHDHVLISLSDLLTPWAVIDERLRAAAAADLVVVLYNPRSKGRTWQLGAARELLLEHRPPATPVGVVTDVARPGELVAITTLVDLDPGHVGMTTCVVVGSSTTRMVAGRMITPRGYVL